MGNSAKGSKKNLSESIRQKLRNIALLKKRPVDEIFRYFAIERFLYRLSQNPFVDHFFLKGGLMFRVWDCEDHRSTMDIDLFGRISIKKVEIRSMISTLAQFPKVLGVVS